METTFVPVDSLEARDAGAGVHELEGLCVPYDVPTTKAGPRPEVFRRGAFASVVTAAGKVRLTDNNHAGDSRRPVGVASELVEAVRDGRAGLWGRFRFYNTPEGRAAFENVREETYGGLSIGFVSVREDVRDGVRNVLEARLHHVSLVDEPAYDDAQVVSVRSADRYSVFRNPPKVLLPADDVPLMAQLRRDMSRDRV
jgi:HK97 family phage prohead protease